MGYSASCTSEEFPVKSDYRIISYRVKEEEILSLRSYSVVPREGVTGRKSFKFKTFDLNISKKK